MQEARAQQVLKQYWDGNLPVNVEGIALRMGISIRKELFMPESGIIEINNNSPRIKINANEPLVRQRFTIAHEIGHYALGHVSANGQSMMRDTSAQFNMGANPVEREANRFAAALLMPEDALRYVIANGVARSLPVLAQLFGVSQAAMQYRVNNLGLFSNI